ncbi:hypothetical protein ACWX0K_15155 [Nitrobacteraceae bacterium UC4446_H13]
MERLKEVAILRDGEILHRGCHSHFLLRQVLDPNDPDPRHGNPGDVDGFVTSTGRFVNRQEAKAVAIGCGQLHERWKEAKRDLLSSDIDWEPRP